MNPLERFAAYAADFEKTYDDDDWSRLEGYFADGAVYEVKGEVPFACEVEGRDEIFRAIKKCLDGFDRRFPKRGIEIEGPPEVEGRRVTVVGTAHYDEPGVEPVSIRLAETAEFDEEGRIVRLCDEYDGDVGPMLEWIERYGKDYDFQYV